MNAEVPLRQVWEAHPSPYGVPYYYNPKTKESRWSVPTGPLDVVVPAESKEPKNSKTQNAKASKAATKLAAKKEPQVEYVSSSCSTSESDDVPNPQSAAERAKEKVDNFKALLEEKGVQGFDTFDNWLPRLLADSRFTAVPKSQRRKLFQRVAQNIGAGQRKLQAEGRRQGREGFLQLLELARSKGYLQSVSLEATMAQMETTMGQDPRWSQISAAERARLVEVALVEMEQAQQQGDEAANRALRSLLLEKVFHDSGAHAKPPTFEELSHLLQSEPRWSAVASEQRRDICISVTQEVMRKWAVEKKEDQAEEDDLMEKRKRSRYDLAEEEFRNLLDRKIRSPLEFSWKEVTMVLDGERLPELDEVDLETIFNQVRSEDLERRLSAFSSALLRSTLTAEITLRAAIQCVEMEEYLRTVPENDLKKRLEDWRRFRLTEDLETFSAWLRQTPSLHEYAQAPKDKAMEELCQKLESDIRYRRLDWVPTQRMKLITARLDEIAAEKLKQSDSE